MADKQGEKLLCHQTNLFSMLPLFLFLDLFDFWKSYHCFCYSTQYTCSVSTVDNFCISKLYFISRGKWLTFIQMRWMLQYRRSIVVIQEVYCCNMGKGLVVIQEVYYYDMAPEYCSTYAGLFNILVNIKLGCKILIRGWFILGALLQMFIDPASPSWTGLSSKLLSIYVQLWKLFETFQPDIFNKKLFHIRDSCKEYTSNEEWKISP